MKKVIVGMSGGVDSSVSVHLLKEQGFEVEGLSFILYEARLKNTFSGCCSIEAINDAAGTAGRLGVKHTVMDLREVFTEKVIEPFVEAYSKGLTPNPCILCNRHIKFPYLLKAARANNADFIATGHYAKTVQDKNITLLKKGLDAKKDQSYVLYVLSRDELNSLVLPLADRTKDEVRDIARDLDLPAAKRPESQEICFVEDGRYFSFLEHMAGDTEGPVVDVETKEVLGRHKGIHLYTIGQRKRLGVASLKPLYVTGIDPAQNTVYVGPKEKAMMREFIVGDINLLQSLPDDHEEFRAAVKVRSTMEERPATIKLLNDGRILVVYDEPQWAPAPGQSAVFYDGDTVMGGGIIS
jgi:tRNA-specific 2-thiouridylase